MHNNSLLKVFNNGKDLFSGLFLMLKPAVKILLYTTIVAQAYKTRVSEAHSRPCWGSQACQPQHCALALHRCKVHTLHIIQEALLLQRNRTMRYVSWNIMAVFWLNYRQEALLMQRNHASTLSVEICVKCHTKCSTDCICKRLQAVNDLQGHLRSLQLIPFDRPYTIS